MNKDHNYVGKFGRSVWKVTKDFGGIRVPSLNFSPYQVLTNNTPNQSIEVPYAALDEGSTGYIDQIILYLQSGTFLAPKINLIITDSLEALPEQGTAYPSFLSIDRYLGIIEIKDTDYIEVTAQKRMVVKSNINLNYSLLSTKKSFYIVPVINETITLTNDIIFGLHIFVVRD